MRKKHIWKQLLKEYMFKCIGCEKHFIITPNILLKYLENSERFYCLDCINGGTDYRICGECKSKNPLGYFECIYCGHIEVMT